MTNPKKRIFISHIHEEARLGQTVKTVIEEVFSPHGVTAFLSSDQRDIPAGRKWLDVVGSELDQATVVISLLSPTALGRPWVNIELGAAWIKGLSIIPFCHSSQRVSDLPRPFGDFNGVGLDQDDAVSRLISGVADGLGLKPPQRLALKDIQEELRVAAAQSSSPVAPTSVAAPAAAAPALEAPAIRILQVLAARHDSEQEPISKDDLADDAGVKRSAYIHYLEDLSERDYIHVNYSIYEETTVTLRPKGAEWLLRNEQMPQ